jgi:hypothetical protein
METENEMRHKAIQTAPDSSSFFFDESLQR